ncbi:hypothetical protein GCM10010302_32230 [Streptomyces polychromogenes]|uniref:Uncharacterized protein n=1 Tax=Streptomyces polychromogenes TaxID=67342 RepID=A0ABN0VE76_9ACTN
MNERHGSSADAWNFWAAPRVLSHRSQQHQKQTHDNARRKLSRRASSRVRAPVRRPRVDRQPGGMRTVWP